MLKSKYKKVCTTQVQLLKVISGIHVRQLKRKQQISSFGHKIVKKLFESRLNM